MAVAPMDITSTNFSDLGLSANLLRGIHDAGYTSPTPIQSGSIPCLLAGRDMIGKARTGTGKTAAFSLPMLDGLNPNKSNVQALVLTPTRELAIQVTDAMTAYAKHLNGIRLLTVYGGQPIVQQLKELRRGVHVVVGTPGRVLDHIRRGSLKLGNVKMVVLDEADEMLRMGFIDDVETILSETSTDRHTALFSATMPKEILSIAHRHLNKPETVAIETTTEAVIEQRFIRLKHRQKPLALDRLLQALAYEGVLIFARTRADTIAITEQLVAQGHAAECLHGEMSQGQREHVMNRFKEGSLDIVVGTDVAARGIDVDHLTHVINFDTPGDVDTYVHRIGRTGRAGRKGMAITLITPNEMRMLKQIEYRTQSPVDPMAIPSIEEVHARQAEKYKEQLRQVLAENRLEPHYRLVKDLEKEGFHITQIAAASAQLANAFPPAIQAPELSAPRQTASDKPKRNRRRRSRSNSRSEQSNRRRPSHRRDDANGSKSPKKSRRKNSRKNRK